MQQNLLDTHTIIWYINGDKELSKNARTFIESEVAVNLVSISSLHCRVNHQLTPFTPHELFATCLKGIIFL